MQPLKIIPALSPSIIDGSETAAIRPTLGRPEIQVAYTMMIEAGNRPGSVLGAMPAVLAGCRRVTQSFGAGVTSLRADNQAAAEWAWAGVRIAIAGTCGTGAILYLRDTAAYAPIMAAVAFVIAYNTIIGYILTRGHVRRASTIGFILDNATVLGAWWITAAALAGTAPPNDMYLALFPFLIRVLIRVGWAVGMVYTAAWLGWMSWVSIHYYGFENYHVEQLPIRLLFITITAGLTLRLVARLQQERRRVESLSAETSILAETGRIVSSSLDVQDVYERLTAKVGELIPFDRLAIVIRDGDDRGFQDAYVAGATATDDARLHPSSDPAVELATIRRAGVMLNSPLQPTSRLVAPLISNSQIIGAIDLQVAAAGAYTDRELSVAERVADQVAGAVQNALLHQEALHLAEERELRSRLDAENRELQRVNEAKSTFLSTVSHELRTPLTSIIAFNDLLLRNRDGNLTPVQKQQLQVMRRNGGRLSLLISDLLDVSRIDAGNLRLEVQHFDAIQLFRELKQSFAPVLQARSQAMSMEIPAYSVWLEGDQNRIAQVVANLVSNASKYSPDGALISISARVEAGRLHVAVTDRGIGMSEDNVRQLFTPFFRVDNEATRSQPGTGLGLVIARRIIELHGGEMHVSSEEGLGTTVSFYVGRIVSGPRAPAA